MSNYVFMLYRNEGVRAHIFWPEGRIFYDLRLDTFSGEVANVFHGILPLRSEDEMAFFRNMRDRHLTASYEENSRCIDIVVQANWLPGADPGAFHQGHTRMDYLAVHHELFGSTSSGGSSFEFRGLLEPIVYDAGIARYGLANVHRQLIEETQSAY